MNELKKRFTLKGVDIKLICGDAYEVKLQKDKFDIILALDVLERIPNIKLRLFKYKNRFYVTAAYECVLYPFMKI